MNRPIAKEPLDLATVVQTPRAGRAPMRAALLLGLAAIIIFESAFDWGGLIGNVTEAPAAGPLANFTVAAPARTERRSDYSDYLQAPIFLASREPIILPDAARTSAAIGQSRDLGLALHGTIISEGEPVALMKTLPNGEVVLLRRGEELGGWMLLDIEDRLVRLQRDDEIFELYLDLDSTTGEAGLPQGAGRK